MALFLDPRQTATPSGARGGDVVKDSNTERFAADVLDSSMEVPVIVDFWAPWCGPCKQMTPLLEKLVRQAGGLVRLVKINVDENQALAMQLQIQSIPAVYAFSQGRPVDAFVGAQPESALRAFIDRLTRGAKPPTERALEQGQAALEAGDAKAASALFARILKEDPTNPKAMAGLVRARLSAGDPAGARDLLGNLPPDVLRHPDVAAAVSAVDLAEEGGTVGDVAALQAKADADPTDLGARFELAKALYAKGRPEAAIDTLLGIVQRDRDWNDEAARKQLVKIFDALGASHPLTVTSRRRLSSILFS